MLCAVAATAVLPSVALAQEVVMRRPLPFSQRAAGQTDWHTTPWVSMQNGSPVADGQRCGVYTDQRTVTCRKPDGSVVGDYFCTAPKPSSEMQAEHREGCTYAWSVQDWQDPGDACTAAETQTRAVSCLRGVDSAPVADSFCGGARPETSRQVPDYSSCSYSWRAGQFVDPGAGCTLTERQDRQVSCIRDLDQAVSADTLCDASSRPATFQIVRDDAACTYRWDSGAFVDPGASCTRSETQTRSVRCLSSLGDEVVGDDKCSGAKPAATQMVEDYASCTYSAVNWTDAGWSSTCSATAVHNEKADCQRSNDGGEIVPAATCAANGVEVTRQSTLPNYDSCANSWATAAFVDPGPSCTASEVQTRAVWCRRDLDDAVQDDAQCTPATRPSSSQSVTDYSGCSYSAVNWSAWSYGSTCSAGTTRTQTAQCRRSDGTIVPGADCVANGVAVSVTESGVSNYSTCSNSWATGTPVDPGASCTANEVRTQAVWCKRDLDGSVQPDASCNAAVRPAATINAGADYSGCSYSAVNWSAWTNASTCSAGTTRTRTATCQRSDGTSVAASECTSRSVAVSQTESGIVDYSGCTYDWAGLTFQDPGASCGSETWTRTPYCSRSLDSAAVADSFCASKGAKPASTDVRTDYSGCGYAAVNWSAWTNASTCSNNTTRTRTATCQRSDGTAVAASECTSRGIALSETQSGIVDVSTCTNSWSAGAPVDPGASCTANEFQTRSVVCKRDLDGTVLPDASCNAATRPSSTVNAGADYSGCGYSAVNWSAWTNASTCSNNTTRTRTATCQRSDGTAAAASECTSRGIALSETQGGIVDVSTCSNSWATGAPVDPGASCTANETQTRSVWCKRDLDGAVLADASCDAGSRPAAAVNAGADYSGCTFTPVDGGYGACDGTNRPHYWSCQRSDGTGGFPAANCGKSNPEYENCYSYALSPQQTSCSNGQQTVTNRCIRSDGQQVASSFCGVPATTVQSCSSYSWYQSGFGAFGACQAPGVQYQYQTVYCQQNFGGSTSQVDDSLCGGGKPATQNSQSCGYYSYRWVEGGFSDWNTHCGSATRTQAVWCFRNPDNAYMPDQTQCYQTVGNPPASTQSAYVVDGCGYTPSYGGFGACSSGSQSQSMTSCTRSDGVGVDVSECINRGNPATRSQACASAACTSWSQSWDPGSPGCGGTVLGYAPLNAAYGANNTDGNSQDLATAQAFCTARGASCCAIVNYGTPDGYNTPLNVYVYATSGPPNSAPLAQIYATGGGYYTNHYTSSCTK